MRQIRIERLKHIEDLQFDVPDEGVYLLCGANGSGKSTLLACLLRIGVPTAFSNFFRTSAFSKQLDQHDGAHITYTVANRSVRYWYGGERWSPTPKKNTDVLGLFGFANVFYAGANAKRIEPRPEDFRPQRVRDAPAALRIAAETILSDSKFQHLKCINVRKGIGAEAFLLLDEARIALNKNQRNYYFSERNFSLGELCVLKLLRDLDSCKPNSLVLIDELELALHPAAQIRLFEHLQGLSKEKHLTVIFSTHSISLIKAAKQNQLMLLTKCGATINCVRGVYPAQAIGMLATSLDGVPDRVIFVEDNQARFIVEAAIARLIAAEFSNSVLPTIVILPVGPFMAVVDFLERVTSLLGSTPHFGLLDEDVKSETVSGWQVANNHSMLSRFQAVDSKLKYLPWTPETGIAKRLRANLSASEHKLRNFIADQRMNLSQFDWSGFDTLAGSQLRSKSKEIVSATTKQIAALRGIPLREAERMLAQFFVHEELDDPATAARIKQLLLPLLR